MLTAMLMTWMASSILMTIAYGIQYLTKDASWVDVFWSASIGVASLTFFLVEVDPSVRHIIILTCVLLWSSRLTVHLSKRLHLLQAEDQRYQVMRQSLGNYVESGFFFFFQLQAFFVVIFTAPIYAALRSTPSDFLYTDSIAVSIFLIAWIGEAIADQQLLRHKRNYPSTVTCQNGLWRYSRHPNYFFEWIHWFSYTFFAWHSDYFLVSLIMPFVMLVFLLKLTGIPHIEQRALETKNDYAEYMRTTSLFIPFFKRKK